MTKPELKEKAKIEAERMYPFSDNLTVQDIALVYVNRAAFITGYMAAYEYLTINNLTPKTP